MKHYTVVIDTRTGEVVSKNPVPDFNNFIKSKQVEYPEPQYSLSLVEECPSKESRTFIVVKQLGEVIYRAWYCPQNWTYVQSSYPTSIYNVQVIEEPAETKCTYLLVTDAQTQEVVKQCLADSWTLDGQPKLEHLAKRYPPLHYKVRVFEEEPTGSRSYVVIADTQTGSIVQKIDITNGDPRFLGEEVSALKAQYREPRYCVDRVVDVK
ncbi:hypothetical protein H6F88_13005 [Oculatella sp. FACHB-28]|uniref:hypothetical protein n=1 Tax=Oculatella sp. FACHB-28 TaxID=2692845 RepID=UPI001687675F|nr:hypothetical protein [Oculatella sp. FACHB-28]MBD1865880.1 hypothetical protein [Cyanobacteria bacterium FACHB-471]MBD2056921.1 hypothetical protein [Oculatella sp. FACHB-28]